MSVFSKTLTEVQDKALAAVTEMHNDAIPVTDPITPPLTQHEYLDKVITSALKSWQDQHIKLPASEFLLRFPAGKIDAIKALAASGNTQLQAYIEELKVAPFVYTGSTLVRGGIASLVTAGLLTQAQADVILA